MSASRCYMTSKTAGSNTLIREMDRLMFVKYDLQTSHAYHFKIALQRLWEVNVSIAELYLKK